jgi:hypothetical protein
VSVFKVMQLMQEVRHSLAYTLAALQTLIFHHVRVHIEIFAAMEEVLVWCIKKIFFPWLVKKILGLAWCQLRENRNFQRLVIILYLCWQLKTTSFKSLPISQNNEKV